MVGGLVYVMTDDRATTDDEVDDELSAEIIAIIEGARDRGISDEAIMAALASALDALRDGLS